MTPGYTAIAALLKARSGLVLGPDKLYLVETRLDAMMKREGLKSLDALAGKLKPGSPLEREVVDLMTTNETLFFRDSKPFDALRLRILPRLHASRPAGARLRLWSAAASTGQEPYSLAMTTAETTALQGRAVDILATDISPSALQRAREGIYSQFEIQRGLPMQMLAKYFEKDGTTWKVKPSLRQGITFQEWNLLSDGRPLGQFDIIFCRNVLIYFDPPTKVLVLEGLARQLAPDGVLFLGGAETVLGLTEALTPLAGESGAYEPGRRLAHVA